MKAAHFAVTGDLDGTGRPMRGTVTIDRRRGLFAVRPLRRRRVYELPLAAVADLVVRKVVIAEVKLAQLERMRGRRDRADARRRAAA